MLLLEEVHIQASSFTFAVVLEGSPWMSFRGMGLSSDARRVAGCSASHFPLTYSTSISFILASNNSVVVQFVYGVVVWWEYTSLII